MVQNIVMYEYSLKWGIVLDNMSDNAQEVQQQHTFYSNVWAAVMSFTTLYVCTTKRKKEFE